MMADTQRQMIPRIMKTMHPTTQTKKSIVMAIWVDCKPGQREIRDYINGATSKLYSEEGRGTVAPILDQILWK